MIDNDSNHETIFSQFSGSAPGVHVSMRSLVFASSHEAKKKKNFHKTARGKTQYFSSLKPGDHVATGDAVIYCHHDLRR